MTKVDLDRVIELDSKRIPLKQRLDEIRAERNKISDAMKSGKPDPAMIEKSKSLKDQLQILETESEAIETEFLTLYKKIPNIPTADTPVGLTEDDNMIVRQSGSIPSFAFPVKSHADIANARGWLDKERAAKVAGARFAYVKGDLARLHYAIMSYGMDVLGNQEIIRQLIDDRKLKTSDKPFVLVMPPAVARTDVYDATGRLNKEEQTYKLADDDLWLNASAEHVLAPMYLDEIIDEKDLPIRMVGYTTAFRREAGTYGKDMEGILRMHQFDKLEMESFTTADTSDQDYWLMVAIEEYLMAQLELPYRVLLKCTADIGLPNARGIDIEVWFPSQWKYRETHSADYITDYQARRMNTRVRRTDGTLEFVHTNDATAFSQRPLIAILENYQNEDMTVRIPKVLQPYMGGKEIL